MMQNTLVAFYGPKPDALVDTIISVQDAVKASLGGSFQAYAIDQVHATIIGLEHKPASLLLNANFARHRGIDATMDVRGYLEFILSPGNLPFEILIGGFQDRDYSFCSRGQRPYRRSFSIQSGDDGGRVVIMGWPVRRASGTNPVEASAGVGEKMVYPMTLDYLRRAAQEFGILHEYHRTASDIDNDFYFRVGVIEPGRVKEAEKEEVELKLRQQLQNEPLLLKIDAARLSIASYVDNKLPVDSTTIASVSEWTCREHRGVRSA